MPKTKPKIVIAVPCSDSEAMKALTAQAIGSSIISAEGMVIDLVMRRSCDIVSNRTWLVNQAIAAGASHMLFVDCDMFFPHDVISKLLAHDKDIVGVEYNKREFPLECVSRPLTEKADTLYEAKYAGTGLMLINLSIFKEDWKDPQTGNKTPWFNFGRDSQGALALGEDAWFCYSARDNGFTVWIDPTISVKHIGEFLY